MPELWLRGRARRRSLVLGAVALASSSCTMQVVDDGAQTQLAFPADRATTLITPAPARLRGYIALPTGARLYAQPDFASSSWELDLAGPPLATADAPPRTRAFRVVGIVDDPYNGDFLAVTNDLASNDDAQGEREPGTELAAGCGIPVASLPHLRVLLYVPLVYPAAVTTRSLELELHSPSGERERVHFGAGVRVGPPSDAGMPMADPGHAWRWIDADGIRVVAPIPEDAVGVAWSPARRAALQDAGEPLLRDADGSIMWLLDDGGPELELSFRNGCGEYRRHVADPSEVESLRELALEVFYDQRPPAEQPPDPPSSADFLIEAGTPLRWPDGALAGEILHEWAVAVSVGRTWNDRRCFTLELGSELVPVDEASLACVNPEALTPVGVGAGESFAVSDELELGGSIQLGPARALLGRWDDVDLRGLLNARHERSAECLRPLLVNEEGVEAGRWLLDMVVDDSGRVDTVELTALGPSTAAVEECLTLEAQTWMFPGGEGRLRVPLTLGEWTEPESEATNEGLEFAADAPSEDAPASKPERKRGRVVIIRDEDPEDQAGNDEDNANNGNDGNDGE